MQSNFVREIDPECFHADHDSTLIFLYPFDGKFCLGNQGETFFLNKQIKKVSKKSFNFGPFLGVYTWITIGQCHREIR